MNKQVFLLFVLAAQLAATDSAAASWKSYAVIVGVNESVVPRTPPLRFADDDAARYHEVFRSGIQDVKSVQLFTRLDSSSRKLYPQAAKAARAATRSAVLAALRGLARKIRADRARGRSTALYFVYSGHGHVGEDGEGFVSLRGGRFTRGDLYREVVEGSRATRVHLIIDACNARHFVGARGPWRPDRGGTHLDRSFKEFLGRKRWRDHPNLGVLLSTTAAGATHEWTRIQGGVFSHEVRSGLLGAADADANGTVTYAEMRAFLVAANKKVTHAKARLAPLVYEPESHRKAPLWSWRAGGLSRLALGAGDRGRVTVEDSRGLPYADLNKEGGSQIRLVLLGKPGRSFWVRRAELLAVLRLPPAAADLQLSGLQFEPDKTTRRGSADDALRAGLFAVAFGPQFYEGFVAAVPPTPLPVVTGVEDPEPRTGSLRRTLGWSAVGLAGASLVATSVLGGLAARDASTLSDRLEGEVLVTDEDRALDGRLSRERTAAWVMGGVTVAAGVAGAVLLLLDRRDQKERRVTVVPTGTGIHVATRLW
jgi:hypothetical protein